MQYSTSIEINAPIEQAFDCVDDNEKLKQWAEGVEEIIPLDPWDPANPVGSRFKQRIREGGRVNEYEGEVTAYDKPHHIAITLGGAAFTMAVDYRFTALDAARTRLDYHVGMVAGSWWARVMGVAFGWLTRRIAAKQLAALKALAESQAHAESAGA